ncbi:MAG: aspartate kinase [Alphaproteobacteria bacterium]|nr:aspartate kinase [Alphaproteobacteria bacterium]MCB9984748.1 aspartate kinase [Micavibrio sp.]HPQ50143.1 aspartate kinase [Alphaproteobacteria bacterium]
MARIVVKFGGTSVADPSRIENAADKVLAEWKRGNQVVVVVSAMAGITNQLVDYCQQIDPGCDACEYDAVVASGEQITSGLMALALQKRGLKSRSFMGWQVPIICNEQHGRSRIDNIPPEKLLFEIENDIIPVIAGFQGISKSGRVSTLGRGGSDTTAVAVAAALKAHRCDIYTDVDGVYTTDPRMVSSAKKLDRVSYEEMLEMAALGAKVLHPRSVELAMAWNVQVQVLSSFETKIGSDLPGTIIVGEDNIVEKQIVNGVTYTRNESKITLLSVSDMPGVAAAIFAPLGGAGINVDVIVQNVSPDGKTTDMTFTVPKSDAIKAKTLLEKLDFLADTEIRIVNNIAKISIIGIGMSSHTSVAKTMFTTLAENKINIQAITTSEIKVSVLIDEKFTELAVRALHSAFGLDQEEAS